MGGYIFLIGSQPSILFCDTISFRICNLIGEIAIIGYPCLHGNMPLLNIRDFQRGFNGIVYSI